MEERIAVGEVTAAQGNKGEVRVFLLTDFPARFAPGVRVFWERDGAGRELTVESSRPHKGMAVVKFAGCSSISDAEALIGGVLAVNGSEAVKLPPGHYYIHEIVGLAVYTTGDEYLGRVVDVFRTGSNDVYAVRRDAADTKTEILLPAIKDVVREIDIATGKMRVELLDGLVEPGR